MIAVSETGLLKSTGEKTPGMAQKRTETAFSGAKRQKTTVGKGGTKNAPEKAIQAQNGIPASDLLSELETNACQALLVGMHRDARLLSDFFAICPAEAFRTPSVAPVMQALDLLRLSGTKPGLETLAQQMNARWAEQPEKWPRPDVAALASLTQSIWGEDHALWFADRVAREYRRDQLRGELLLLAAQAGQYGVDPEELADSIRKLGECTAVSKTETDLSGLMSRVLARAAKPGGGLLPMPWPALTRCLRGGMQRQELVVLAGRPGTGKTAFAGCIAVEAARVGHGVLFISREMGDESLAARLLAREARVDNRFFREGLAAQSEQTQAMLQQGAHNLATLPLAIVEKSVVSLTPREVRRLARGVPNLGLVVVDYLQLMQPDEPSRSREQDVASMSRAFKTLAMDLDVPVLLLAQLNRSSEQGEREPRVSDLRESGAIEQDADIVLLLHTRNVERTSSTPIVKCIVGKSRNTATGATYFMFRKAVSDFEEVGERQFVHQSASIVDNEF